MEWAKLNVFQRLTRQWDSLHPYNAAQMMKLDGTIEPPVLESAWQSTLRDLSLGPAKAVQNRFRFEPPGESTGELLEVEPDTSIDQFITRELNRSFAPDGGVVFRPFIKRVPGGQYVGVVYHHWVADSYSIRILLHEWFLRLYDPTAARRRPLQIATRGYWDLFGPPHANWSVGGAMLGMLRWSANFRKARRVDPEAFSDMSVNFSSHFAPPGLIEAVARSAKQCGVTVNDVFLAAMAEVCDRLVPVKRTDRRPDLALGTIVDLRPKSSASLHDAFGLYLGFTSVFCRPEDLADFPRLVTRVHQQNDLQKRCAAAESSMLRMLSGLVVARMLKRKRLLDFYRKRLALAGGISNVNLNRDWPGRHHPSPLIDYVRVSPAGPMMPLVFTPTTIGSSLNIGLTCRNSVIPASKAQELAAMFIDRLERFAEQVG